MCQGANEDPGDVGLDYSSAKDHGGREASALSGQCSQVRLCSGGGEGLTYTGGE